MRPPYYVPQGARYVPPSEGRIYRPTSRLLRVLTGLALLAALAVLLWLFAASMSGAGPATFTTAPGTYGPPGPSGGPA